MTFARFPLHEKTSYHDVSCESSPILLYDSFDTDSPIANFFPTRGSSPVRHTSRSYTIQYSSEHNKRRCDSHRIQCFVVKCYCSCCSFNKWHAIVSQWRNSDPRISGTVKGHCLWDWISYTISNSKLLCRRKILFQSNITTNIGSWRYGLFACMGKLYNCTHEHG